ncbi:MAG: T9SS type A sorting domain-containing protein [bacterium]|nr:T9SS type A sorting domain-containing protein [bacterium]
MNRSSIFTVFFFLSIIIAFSATSQGHLRLIAEGERDFSKLREAFYEEWKEQGSRYSDLKKFKRWENFIVPRLKDGKIPGAGYFKQRYDAYELIKADKNASKRQQNSWQSIGPYKWEVGNDGYNPGNGRINCITVDPNDPNKVYIGAASGGFWKSLDGGQTWHTSTDDLGVLGVTDIYVDPDNTDRIIILTGDAYGSDTPSIGLFESLDAGESWELMNLSFDRNEFKTFYKLEVGKENKDLMFVAGSNIIRSVDGGETWEEVQTGTFSDLAMHPTNDSILYACDRFDNVANQITLYKSVDAGLNWERLIMDFPEANKTFGRKALGVTPANPDVVYILSSASDATFGGLFKSSDQLNSVTLMSSTPNIFGYSKEADDNSGQGWYDLAIGVSPEDENELYVSGVHVWKSMDSGENWELQNYWIWSDQEYPYVHADNHTIDYYHGNVYCGGDGGIFYSEDDGETFDNLSFGLNIAQFYRLGTHPEKEDVVVGGLQDNGSFAKINDEWYHIFGADGMEALIDHTDPNTVYSEYQNGGIIRYTNEGLDTDWFVSNADNEPGGWVTPFIMHPNDHNTLYFGYQNVWVSNDRGETLTKNSNFNGASVIDILKMHPTQNNTFLVGRGGLLYYSTDEARSFSEISAGLPSLPLTDAIFDVANPDRIWASLFEGNVYQSNDAGESWFSVSEGLPFLSVNCLLQHPCGEILYAGTDVGVYTLDLTSGNRNWEYMGSGLPNVIVREMEIQNATSKLYVATYGRGIWKIDVPEVTEGEEIQSITFQDIEDKRLSDEKFALVAESSSALEISFISSDDRIVLIDGDSAKIIGLGAVEISAMQYGNCAYQPADTVTKSFEVLKGIQTIDFEEIATDVPFRKGRSFSLYARSSASLPITFVSSDENLISINGDRAVIESDEGGTVTITASQEGSEFYEAAENVDQEITFLILDAETLESNPLYPNPTTRFVNLPPDTRGAQYRLFNLSGRLVKRGIVSNKNRVDISDGNSGRYILEVAGKTYQVVKK